MKVEVFEEVSPERLRECIEQGLCPWCQKNGLRRLASHTVQVHGISADDIRTMAILCKHYSTCTKEETECNSIRVRRLVEEGRIKPPDWRLAKVAKKEYSEAGLIKMRQKAQDMRDHIAKCRRERIKENRMIGLRVAQMLGKITKPKPHECPTCGRVIPKSHPKYCCVECGRQGVRDARELKLPMDDIKTRYLNGESSRMLAKIYGCADETIRRRLRKIGVTFRRAWDWRTLNG